MRAAVGKKLAIGLVALLAVGVFLSLMRVTASDPLPQAIVEAMDNGLRPVLQARQARRIGQNRTSDFRSACADLKQELLLISQDETHLARFPAPPSADQFIDLIGSAPHVASARTKLDLELNQFTHSVEVLQRIGEVASRSQDTKRFLAVIETLGRMCEWLTFDESLAGYEMLAVAKSAQLSLLSRYGAALRLKPADVDRFAQMGLPPERLVVRALLEGYVDESLGVFEEQYVFGPGITLNIVRRGPIYPTEPGFPRDARHRQPLGRALTKVNPLWARYQQNGDEREVVTGVLSPAPSQTVAEPNSSVSRLAPALELLDLAAESEALRLRARYRPDWGAHPLTSASETEGNGLASVIAEPDRVVVMRRTYFTAPDPFGVRFPTVAEVEVDSWPLDSAPRR